jgi:dihydroxy-acid dehydratase
VLDIIENDGPRPRDIVTRKALENACAMVAATGGSTNAALHIPAIAHEAGIRFTMEDVAEVLQRTPFIGNLRPGGQYHAKDVYEIGGTHVFIKELIAGGFMHGDTLTVTGRTLAEETANALAPDGEWCAPSPTPS